MSQDSPEQQAPAEPSVPDPVPAPGTDSDAPPWPKMEAGSPTLATDTKPTDPEAPAPTT
jgi:hypothetical protein